MVVVTNLFADFDDGSIVIGGHSVLVWVPLFSVLLVFLINHFVVPSEVSYMGIIALRVLYNRAKNVVFLGAFNFFVAVFRCVLFLNFLGVTPMIFRFRGHLYVTITLSFPFWMGIILSRAFYNSLFSFSHLLPVGTPGYLSVFVAYVELFGNFIRPVTLAVRLTANVAAGHIILSCVSKLLVSLVLSFYDSRFFIIICLFGDIFFFLFEFGVSALQSIIFVFLLMAYSTEHAPRLRVYDTHLFWHEKSFVK